MGSGEVVRLFHRETANTAGRRGRRRGPSGFVPMDPGNKPAPFKRYPGLSAEPLPTDLAPAPGGASALEALSGRARPEGQRAALDAGLLARLLFLSAGVTRVAGRGGARTYFRAAPSAGNLHPLEVYAVCGGVAGLEAGVYHFAPDAFGLERLRDGDYRHHVAAATAVPELSASPMALLITAVPWRTAWKYAERGWRHIYWDAGSMLANLLAVAEAYGVAARVLLGFADAHLSRLVGIDGVSELPVAVVALDPLSLRPPDGGSTSATPSAAAVRDTAAPDTVGDPAGDVPADLPELRIEATRLSREPIEFPLITEAQRAGDLGSGQEAAAWRAAAPAGAPAAAEAVEVPATARGEAAEASIEAVILRRGSTRLMSPGSVPAELAGWMMAAAARQAPLDAVPAGRTLLSHEIAVHAVDGLSAGFYRWAEGGPVPRRLLPAEQVRAQAAHLCLDQPLGGDSAYTLFACADLDQVLGAYGDRGYRVAQLEAGLVVGRLQLAAFALGYGGTGLTFFDEEVSAAFGTPAACMLACAIGLPAYRSRPGGGPGSPAELPGFESLMARLTERISRPYG